MRTERDDDQEQGVRSRRRERAALLILLLAICLRIAGIVRVPGRLPWEEPRIPDGMAPGAIAAVKRALGDDGIARITQTLSPGNLDTAMSGGTHRISGYVNGRPYALAFDLAVPDPATASGDTRRLRLQGIAAWWRSPDSPSGAAGNGSHIHCVWPGAPTRNVQNIEQLSSFVHGYRGLVGVGRSADRWRDPSIRPDEIAKVMAGYNTVPGRRPLSDEPVYEVRHRRAPLAVPVHGAAGDDDRPALHIIRSV